MRYDTELERLRWRMDRAMASEEQAREDLERTLNRLGSDRPPERDSDDYDSPPASVAAHG